MIALKCDNCGGYFDFGNDKDPNTLDFTYTDRFRNTNLFIRKHICPACMAAVAKTLEDRKDIVKNAIATPWALKDCAHPFEDDLK